MLLGAENMLTLVMPVYNEQESLAPLWGEIAEVARGEQLEIEAIFVDDGSQDESWKEISRLAAADPRVKGIRFRGNFGKAAALSAGFAASRGELVMTLDADLQDDPKEIPRFLAKIDEGRDVVSGWKKKRYDPWHKVLPSRVFNWMVSRMTGVKLHDHNCGMKCYRREAVEEVRIYGELHRFVPVLCAAKGFRVGELVIHHRPRKYGKSKYGVKRFIRGFLDLLTVKFLTDFEHRPQHLLGGLGLLFFVLGSVGLVYMAGLWVVSRLLSGMEPVDLHTRPLVLYSMASMLFGGQLLSLGLLAEMFVARAARPSDIYSIAEETPEPDVREREERQASA